jgi:hypothetical protein
MVGTIDQSYDKANKIFPTLQRWREHNGADNPENIIVTLCTPCGNKLIEKHPRLYSRVYPNTPEGGAMTICQGCKFLDNNKCTNPRAIRNGGEGVAVITPRPTRVHLNYGGKGGKWIESYPSPPKTCEGREQVES